MKGYLIAKLDVDDRQAFDTYREKVLPLISPIGGRDLVRDGDLQGIEGELVLDSLVVK